MNNALNNSYDYSDLNNHNLSDNDGSGEMSNDFRNYQDQPTQSPVEAREEHDTKVSKIRIKVNYNGEATVYRVPVNKPFRKCLERYCDSKDLSINTLQFSIDSVPISLDESPESGNFIDAMTTDEDVIVVNVTKNLIGGY